ncbi:MAG: hypothetical protein MSC31_10000 [Solirubrobacteraceae bacterium MAG38_C4-C5]|nr:hypothetical protein [Candidatus Siliceabacter maunaloa]
MERRALEDVDTALSEIQVSLEEAARRGALDVEVLERMAETVKEMAGRLNDSLPPQVDAHTADEIRRRLLSVLTHPRGEGSDLDVADHVLMEMEAVRHILRDLLQEQPPIELRDAGRIVALLEEWLPSVSVAQLAGLLGLSGRQLQRYRREGGAASARAQLVARLVAILRHAWTGEGVVAWFDRGRHDLAGKRPMDLLDEPGANERALVLAARAGRVQGGV